MENKILNILKENPNLSANEIGKLLNVHKNNIIYYLNKMNIKRDRNFIRKNNNQNRSYSVEITENVEQIFLGSILGDGYISKNQRIIEDSKLNLNSQLKIKHSLVQEDYCLYKQKLLNNENIKTYLRYSEPNKIKSYIFDQFLKRQKATT